MTPEESATWEVLCLQYPNAAPFRNCGWEIYEDVKKLCPNKAKGTHSFYPSSGTQGMRDPTSTEGTSMDPSVDSENRFSPDWDQLLDPALLGTPDTTVPPPVEGEEPTKVCSPFFDFTYCS